MIFNNNRHQWVYWNLEGNKIRNYRATESDEDAMGRIYGHLVTLSHEEEKDNWPDVGHVGIY